MITVDAPTITAIASIIALLIVAGGGLYRLGKLGNQVEQLQVQMRDVREEMKDLRDEMRRNHQQLLVGAGEPQPRRAGARHFPYASRHRATAVSLTAHQQPGVHRSISYSVCAGSVPFQAVYSVKRCCRRRQGRIIIRPYGENH